MHKVCYRVGNAPCGTGWIDTANCNDTNIYSAAVGGTAIPGAAIVPCGECAVVEPDQELIVRLYTAMAAGPGFAIGDVLEYRQPGDYSTNPPTFGAVIWTNLKTGAVIAAPGMGNVAPQSGSGGVSPVPSVTRVAHLTDATNAGTVFAGAVRVGFSNEGTANATVVGGTLRPGRTVSFDAPAGDTLAALNYDATGTVLVVAQVR